MTCLLPLQDVFQAVVKMATLLSPTVRNSTAMLPVEKTSQQHTVATERSS